MTDEKRQQPPLRLPNLHTFQLKLVRPGEDAAGEPWTDLDVDSEQADARAALTTYLHGMFDAAAVRESRDGTFHVSDEMLPRVTVDRYYRIKK